MAIKVRSFVPWSTRLAHRISLGMALMPETTDSYNIGKAKMLTTHIGAFELPEITRKRKTKAAVGALLKTMISGLKKCCKGLISPAKEPKTRAKAKAKANPSKVRNKEEPKAFHVEPKVRSSPKRWKVSMGEGKTRFPRPCDKEMMNQSAKTNKTPKKRRLLLVINFLIDLVHAE